MPPYPVRQAYLIVFLLLTRIAVATPQVAFPVNAQLPPVAYVSQPFNFTISPNTFTSGTSEITYALSNQPAWLSIDARSRRFSGTPTESDIGAADFEITASDASGQTVTKVTLIVAGGRSLYPGSTEIETQLAAGGNVSAPSNLLLYPQQTFGFTLTRSLFVGVTSETVFYAVSSDGTPLPSWVQFDPSTLRFSGTTPPQLTTGPLKPQYAFRLISSNVVGFSEASIQFEITISDRLLAFAKTSFSFSSSRGSPLRTPALLGQISIDGVVAQREQIISAVADPPSWLLFNSSDFSFSGTVPPDFQRSVFALVVTGPNTNSANATIVIQGNGRQNTSQSSLGNVTAICGSYFTYIVSLPSGLSGNAQVAVNNVDLPSWLSFIAANKTLQGYVPTDAGSSVHNISFVFNNGLRSVVAYLTLTISPPSITSSGSASRSSSTPASTNSGNPQEYDNDSSQSRKRIIIIVVATVVPLLAVVLLIYAIVACRRRRKRAKGKSTAEKGNNRRVPSTQQAKPHLSGISTGLGSAPTNNSTTPARGSVLRIGIPRISGSTKQPRNRLSKKSKGSLSQTEGLNWDDLIDSQAPSRDDLPPIPSDLLRTRQESDATSFILPPLIRIVPKRPDRPESLAIQDLSHGSQGFGSHEPGQPQVAKMPTRLRAAGHGAGGSRGALRSEKGSSRQTTMDSMPVNNRRRSTTVIMGSFPEPPLKDNPTQARDKAEDTLRPVQSNNGSNALVGSSSHAAAGGKGSESNLYATPPIPPKSHARKGSNVVGGGSTNNSSRIPVHLAANREISATSSRQFDSAVSSDSQWEDESVVAMDDTLRRSHGNNNLALPSHKPAPRSSARPGPGVGRYQLTSDVQRLQFANQRRQLGVEGHGLQVPQRGHQASSRFI